ADPISGQTDFVLINASWGLGEALVSGMVTPDQVIVGSGGAIHEDLIGEEAEMIVPRADAPGTQTVPVPRLLCSLPALNREQIDAISAMHRATLGAARSRRCPARCPTRWDSRPISKAGGLARRSCASRLGQPRPSAWLPGNTP